MKKTEYGSQRHIRIWNDDLWKQIERIQALPEYKSLNKVLNEALEEGLPILIKHLFEGEEEEPMESAPIEQADSPQLSNCPDRDFCWRLVLLLTEINANVLLIKKIVSSNQRALEWICEMNPGLGELLPLLKSGALDDVPDRMAKEEAEALKRLSALSKGDRKR